MNLIVVHLDSPDQQVEDFSLHREIRVIQAGFDLFGELFEVGAQGVAFLRQLPRVPAKLRGWRACVLALRQVS